MIAVKTHNMIISLWYEIWRRNVSYLMWITTLLWWMLVNYVFPNCSQGAKSLKELDISSNALEGPVGPTTLPTLWLLETLHLSDNTFASIRRGALAGISLESHMKVKCYLIPVTRPHMTDIFLLLQWSYFIFTITLITQRS